MPRVFATGDMHGWDGSRWKLDEEHFPVGYRELCKDDVVIVTGDMAAVFFCDAAEPLDLDRCAPWERDYREWLESRPWTWAFVDGNHENHDALAALPVGEWRGGAVHRVSPSVIHLMRGQSYSLPLGKGEETTEVSVFAMGGARSVDRYRRTEGRSWWPSELPGYDEIDAAEATLDSLGWDVDLVLTHAQPVEVAVAATGMWEWQNESDRLASWLGYVRDRLSYRLWLSGHLHVDASALGGRDRVLFDDVLELTPGDFARDGA